MMRDKVFYFIFFLLLLALSRLIPHPPNFTPILATSIMAPLLMKDRIYGIALPILAVFVSDIIIGFHSYQLAVYFSLLFISLIAPMKKNYLYLGAMAIGGSLWFYLITNFAVWFMSSMYPKTIEGILSCYVLALPFLTSTLVSTLLFTFLITWSSEILSSLNKNFNKLLNIN
tara:strand:- start:691 stop:1206 length:516 start_codon:yes stop_codon:yes gene_type:complete